MLYDSDVIVVGGGAGGATFAHTCARAGKSVLLLERGRKYVAEKPEHNEQAMLIEKRPYDDREVEVNGVGKRLYVGGVLGGGTALYGAALLRPSQEDFHPGRHYGDRIPRAIWDWPISYHDLESHYAEAERLYGVAGCADEDFGPLPRPGGFPKAPLPLHPINRQLMAANRAGGLRPFRLPLAIDPTRCLLCGSCAGYVCPTGARASSAQLVDRADAEGVPLRVLTNVEVERLVLDGAGNVAGVSLYDRATGQRTVRRARRYVLAAGALASPLILLRSGVDGPLVGRHYMMHLSPVVVGIFPRRNGAEESFVKQVGFADYYFGTKGYAHKMGIVQSLPVPGPLLTAKMSPLLPRPVLELLRQRMLPLAGIVEDLPDPANRVCWGPDGQMYLRHRFNTYDIERGRRLARLMARILKRAGALFCVSKPFASDEHVAHQCGTLRFGKDPAHAVLGPDCRLFRHPNVFVVDGSFFPTSLGVGPALTIMANALRVAGIVASEL
ncbi:MAG: GMC family oxidoreductase [Gemmataceae bacterium]|nr:GMC family oxidoreductase [Gemmataceae bacterium]